MPLSSCAGQTLNPTPHLRFRTFDIFRVKPLLKVDPFDRVYRPLEIFFISKGKRGIDTHASLESSVRSRPFFVTCGEPFLWLKSLADPAGNWIQNIRVRIHAR